MSRWITNHHDDNICKLIQGLNAILFKLIVGLSLPPTINRVGGSTLESVSTGVAKSGLPRLETIASTTSGLLAATKSAAAALVLAPKYPIIEF
jgi:hypothetical protein